MTRSGTSTRALTRTACLCGVLALAGCTAEKAPSSPQASAAKADSGTVRGDATSGEAVGGDAAAADAAAAAINVSVVDKAGFQQAIDAHRGKIVLVDYWATWCVPCVKQFPHTVELANKYRDRGVDVIGLSFDDPSNLQPVQAFLADKGASFENLISKVGAQESSADEFEFDGALPHYAIFDREGKIFKRLSPSDPTIWFRPDTIDTALEELLTAQPQP